MAFPLRIMNRSTYDAYNFDPTKDESAIISYSVSKTGWVRVRLVRRDNKEIVLRTIQQWTESHYDNKRTYEIEWDGTDASGNRIDPKQMFILFEARDSINGSAHEGHPAKVCKDFDLTLAPLNRKNRDDSEIRFIARLQHEDTVPIETASFEARVYLDDRLIDSLQVPGSTQAFEVRLDQYVFTNAEHSLTLNLDDGADHIGTATVQLYHGARTAHRNPLAGRQAAPDFTLQDMQGHERRLADYEGKVVLINFWSTSCPACIHEMPSLETLYRNLKDEGFVVMAVAGDVIGERTVKPVVDKLDLTFPVLLDSGSRTAGMYGVSLRPTTYLIDRQGFLVARTVGPKDWMSDDELALIRPLLSARQGDAP